jgi:hypothetical protein
VIFISRNRSTNPTAVVVPDPPNPTLKFRPPRAADVTSVVAPVESVWYTPQNYVTGTDEGLVPVNAVGLVTW